MIQRLQSLTWVLAGLALALLVTRPVDGYDVWWHLHSGLWMLDHQEILLQDHWSFTEQGKPWLNAFWFFQVLMGLAYQAGGGWGLLLLKFLFTLVALLFLAHASTQGRWAWFFTLAFLILLPSIYGHLHLRPLIYEFAALGFIIWVSQRPLDRRLGILSLLVLIGWANTHTSVVVGALALALQALFSHWPAEKDRKVSLVFAGLFLVSPLISPLGVKILDLLIIHEGSISTGIYIDEWVHLATYPPLLWLPFLAVLAAFLLKRLRLSPAEGFLLLFFLYFSIRSQRFELEFATLLLRPLAVLIGDAFRSIKEAKAVQPALVVALLLAAHLLVYRAQIGDLALFQRSEWPVRESANPAITTDLAKLVADKLNRPLRVINEYNFGGYLPFRAPGAIQVLIDGRMSTLFPEQLLILPYETDPRLLDRLAEKYEADAALLKLERAGTLLGRGRWTLVGYDSVSVLFLRSDLAKELNLTPFDYSPATYSNNADEQTPAKITVTEQLLQRNPANSLALNHLALFKSALAKTGSEREEIYDLLRLSDQANPQDGFARATLALLLAREVPANPAALRPFMDALPRPDALTANISTSNDLAYAATLIDAGLADLAADYLYPASRERRRALDTLPEAWRLRLLVDLKRGRLREAVQSLEMARLLYPADAPQQQGLNSLENRLRPQPGGHKE